MTLTSPAPVQQIVVMGVAGVGKTTIAERVSALTGWVFAEGDRFHPAANIAKMSSGQALTDEDRWPWLHSIGDYMSAEIAAGRSGIVTCSALRRVYRDLLRGDRPQLQFCHLAGEEPMVAERIAQRTGHFLPPSLLRSQYETLEPLEDDEPGVTVCVDGDADAVLAHVLDALDLHQVTGRR